MANVVVEKTTKTAEVVVADTNFIAFSRASKEALKSANLLKSLPVNTLILGDTGVGKRTLATFISDSPIVNAKDENLAEYINANESVIIEDFNQIAQPSKFEEIIKNSNTRIIATANKASESLKHIFGVTITLPPLSDRLEDAEALSKIYIKEACEIFNVKDVPSLNFDKLTNHLHVNAQSLRRYIYFYVLTHSLGEKEFMEFSQIYYQKTMSNQDVYKTSLPLFDVPLIKAGFKKFRSQLAMSKSFGINRNTLRKKINENRDYFEEGQS